MIEATTRQAVIEAYKQGIKVRNIATLYDISMPSIYNIVADEDKATRLHRPKRKNPTYEAMSTDYTNGIGIKALAEKYDVSISIVYKALKKSNTPLHKKPTPMQLNIREELRQGNTPTAIAQKYGVSRQYVYLVKERFAL